MIKVAYLSIAILFLTISLLFISGSVLAAPPICGVGATFPTGSDGGPTGEVTWGKANGSTSYLFNGTANPSLIDTACWEPGLGWEALTIAIKPYPHQCTSRYYSQCAEDTENYSSSRNYFYGNVTNRFCVNTDNSGWAWVTAAGGYAQLQSTYAQTCSGGINSYDNNCSAYKYFERLRNGAINFSRWNATGTTFVVDRDYAAFTPSCYGRINGTVTDMGGFGLSGVNVTLKIQSFDGSTDYLTVFTNANGYYTFTSTPATYYKVVFSKESYNSEVVNAKLDYIENLTIDVTLTSGICNLDCTTQLFPSLCSKNCDGIGGCRFNNTEVATLLDGKVINTKQVLTLTAASGLAAGNYTVRSCTGNPAPYTAPSLETARISCPIGSSLIIIERIVLKDSQPVKVVIPVCRQS